MKPADIFNTRVTAILDRLLAAWGGKEPFKNDDSQEVLFAMMLSLLMFADKAGCTPKMCKKIFDAVTKNYRRIKPEMDRLSKLQKLQP